MCYSNVSGRQNFWRHGFPTASGWVYGKCRTMSFKVFYFLAKFLLKTESNNIDHTAIINCVIHVYFIKEVSAWASLV